MARTKAVLGVGVRLTDYISASLLARIYPAPLIEEILDHHGVNSQRTRSLPAVVTVYYCMALSFYPESAYASVYSAIAEGLAWKRGGTAAPTIAKSSIAVARAKIGVSPLQTLHQRVCLPLAERKLHPHAFFAGLRVVAIDGSNFEVADEAKNAAEFGYPGSRTGHAAYPQAQCAILIECESHAILGANLGAYRTAEWTICEPLLKRMTPDMLVLADRGFNGYQHWKAASDTGAQLLWRIPSSRQLPVVKALPDGSYLSAIYPNVAARRSRENEIVVRVIEYGVSNANGEQVRFRLLTTLLDPKMAPALALAQLYHERWEVEGVFDELKTHLRQSRRVFRSKTPEGVRQEFFGWVLAHYAPCWLMHRAADSDRTRARSLSFTAHVELIRRTQPHSGDFSPSAAEKTRALVR